MKWVLGPILLFLLISTSISGFSQFSDTVNYYLNVAGTGSLNKTNTGTNYLLNNSVKFQVDKKKVSLNSMVGHIYGKNPTAKTNDDLLAVMNFDVLRDVQKLYYWGLASYEKSFSLKVEDRFQAGAGVGYTFINTVKSYIQLSDGLLFETADLTQPDQRGRTSYQTVRNSLRVRLRFLIGNIFKIDATDFFQHSLADTKDYIIKLNTTASVKVYRSLNLTMAFNYNRQNITATENLFLSYGISFEKYF
jgi:hypothetical protein